MFRMLYINSWLKEKVGFWNILGSSISASYNQQDEATMQIENFHPPLSPPACSPLRKNACANLIEKGSSPSLHEIVFVHFLTPSFPIRSPTQRGRCQRNRNSLHWVKTHFVSSLKQFQVVEIAWIMGSLIKDIQKVVMLDTYVICLPLTPQPQMKIKFQGAQPAKQRYDNHSLIYMFK